jgi:hypothetical protein
MMDEAFRTVPEAAARPGKERDCYSFEIKETTG